MMLRKRTGILIFPEVEVLDFAGPFEVFSVTRLNEARRREEPSPFEIILVAEQDGTVTATGGLQVRAALHDRRLPGYTDGLISTGGPRWELGNATNPEIH